MSSDVKKQMFRKFIELYFGLLNIIKKQVGHHKDFMTFYNKNIMLKKTNIKMFIKTWYESITKMYYMKIMNENFEYFMEHGSTFLPDKSLQHYFEEFKTICINTEKIILEKAYESIQQMTQLSYMYYQ